ncbi:hypothetical protein BCR34DRAFT_614600 [Clohesyomyces aquaticus]|uniref:RanBP2-type domain-containing protein n=1 Tax=Clohesyomyces aquaticus TaxID=1231657 RepID=A0A1Y1ZNJ7_9PLEO|nr:hypothetical protein BCR34DRAFT_614600 [Clohesyomyces aquaticus]
MASNQASNPRRFRNTQSPSDSAVDKIKRLEATLAAKEAQLDRYSKAINQAHDVINHLVQYAQVSPQSVLLCNFSRLPLCRDVLRRIKTGAVSSIRRFFAHGPHGEKIFGVVVVFMKTEAASKFFASYQNQPLQIGGDGVTLNYRTDVQGTMQMDTHNEMSRLVMLWKPVLSFPKDLIGKIMVQAVLPESDEEKAAAGTSFVPGWVTPLEKEYVAAFGIKTPLFAEFVVEVVRHAQVPAAGQQLGTHFGLLLEFTSVKACKEWLESMNGDKLFQGCLYEVLEDPCDGGQSPTLKVPHAAIPLAAGLDTEIQDDNKDAKKPQGSGNDHSGQKRNRSSTGPDDGAHDGKHPTLKQSYPHSNSPMPCRFKHELGDWDCQHCGYHNKGTHKTTVCRRCSASATSASKEPDTAAKRPRLGNPKASNMSSFVGGSEYKADPSKESVMPSPFPFGPATTNPLGGPAQGQDQGNAPLTNVFKFAVVNQGKGESLIDLGDVSAPAPPPSPDLAPEAKAKQSTIEQMFGLQSNLRFPTIDSIPPANQPATGGEKGNAAPADGMEIDSEEM